MSHTISTFQNSAILTDTGKLLQARTGIKRTLIFVGTRETLGNFQVHQTFPPRLQVPVERLMRMQVMYWPTEALAEDSLVVTQKSAPAAKMNVLPIVG